MKTQDLAQLLQFSAVLQKNRPNLRTGEIAADAANLVKMAKRHKSLSIRRCNEGDEPHIMNPLSKLELKMWKLATAYGRPVFNGDPRGYTVHIHLDSGDYNTLGGKEEGWGIPNY